MVVTSIKLSMISFFLLNNRHSAFPDILRLDGVSGKVDRVEVVLEVVGRLALNVAEVARVAEKFFDHISLNRQRKLFLSQKQRKKETKKSTKVHRISNSTSKTKKLDRFGPEFLLLVAVEGSSLVHLHRKVGLVCRLSTLGLFESQFGSGR